MALASGHWLEKEIKGEAPSARWVTESISYSTKTNMLESSSGNRMLITPRLLPFSSVSVDTRYWSDVSDSSCLCTFHRYGHALAVAGNVAFLFGGASDMNQQVNKLDRMSSSLQLLYMSKPLTKVSHYFEYCFQKILLF